MHILTVFSAYKSDFIHITVLIIYPVFDLKSTLILFFKTTIKKRSIKYDGEFLLLSMLLISSSKNLGAIH
jgi:hypothetical protein